MSTEGVPEGWTLQLLEQCVDILDSRRKPVNSTERAGRVGSVPYYGATGQVGWIDDYLFDEDLLLVGEDGAPFLDKTKPIAYIISGRSWVNNHAHVLRARPDVITNSYLKHYLDHFDFTDFVAGSTRDKLTQASMRAIPIAVPPRPLQDKLVTAIDALLSKKESASAHLGRGSRQVSDRFRLAVVMAACSGRLGGDSTEWRREVAQSLFKWSSGKKLTAQMMQSGEVPVYGGNGVSGRHNQVLVNLPTLVIGRVGALCGNVYVTTGPAWVTDNAIYAKSYSEEILPEWAGLVFERAQLNTLAGGSSQPFVNQTILNGVEVPLPDVATQAELLKRAASLLDNARLVEARIAQAIRRTEQTWQAILAKALRGDLVGA